MISTTLVKTMGVEESKRIKSMTLKIIMTEESGGKIVRNKM